MGDKAPGLRGGGHAQKILTGVAVEVHQPRGSGRCRMAPLTDASANSLHAFVTDHVEPVATVITDAWQGYRGRTSSLRPRPPQPARRPRPRGGCR